MPSHPGLLLAVTVAPTSSAAARALITRATVVLRCTIACENEHERAVRRNPSVNPKAAAQDTQRSYFQLRLLCVARRVAARNVAPAAQCDLLAERNYLTIPAALWILAAAHTAQPAPLFTNKPSSANMRLIESALLLACAAAATTELHAEVDDYIHSAHCKDTY